MGQPAGMLHKAHTPSTTNVAMLGMQAPGITAQGDTEAPTAPRCAACVTHPLNTLNLHVSLEESLSKVTGGGVEGSSTLARGHQNMARLPWFARIQNGLRRCMHHRKMHAARVIACPLAGLAGWVSGILCRILVPLLRLCATVSGCVRYSPVIEVRTASFG